MTETETKSNEKILNDTTSVSGIYKIVNKVNGKYYVGSANIICNRWWIHKSNLRKNRHPNKHLQSAWNKYGELNFEFIIVEKFPIDNLIIAEQKYLDIIEKDKCYNKSFIAGKIEMTDEVRKKLSNKAKKKKSYEHCKNIGLSKKGVFLGNKNPAFDKTIYHFKHLITNEEFIGTRYDFYTKFNLKSQMSHIHQLIHGKRNHVKKWTLFKNDHA